MEIVFNNIGRKWKTFAERIWNLNTGDLNGYQGLTQFSLSNPQRNILWKDLKTTLEDLEEYELIEELKKKTLLTQGLFTSEKFIL